MSPLPQSWIRLRNLRMEHARIGVYAHEQEHVQLLIFHLELKVDIRQASHSDDIVHTLNYALVPTRIAEVLTLKHYALLESLATAVTQDLFHTFSTLETIRLEIVKPSALSCAEVSLVLEQTR